MLPGSGWGEALEPDMPLGEYLQRRRAWSGQAAGG